MSISPPAEDDPDPLRRSTDPPEPSPCPPLQVKVLPPTTEPPFFILPALNTTSPPTVSVPEPIPTEMITDPASPASDVPLLTLKQPLLAEEHPDFTTTSPDVPVVPPSAVVITVHPLEDSVLLPLSTLIWPPDADELVPATQTTQPPCPQAL